MRLYGVNISKLIFQGLMKADVHRFDISQAHGNISILNLIDDISFRVTKMSSETAKLIST